MRLETKSNWRTAFTWLTLMSVTYFYPGIPDLVTLLASAWICLVVAGVLVVIWEHVGSSSLSAREEELKAAIAECSRLTQEVEAMRKQHQEASDDQAREQAERVFAELAQAARENPLTEQERAALVEERRQILDELRKLGFKTRGESDEV